MSNVLVAVIGVVYLYVGIEQAFKGNLGGALMWAGYALANLGIIVGGVLK